MRSMRCARPIVAAETILVPLENVTLHKCGSDAGFLVWGSKEPAVVVISSPQGRWAVDVHGTQVSLEACIEEVEGLQAVLDSLQA